MDIVSKAKDRRVIFLSGDVHEDDRRPAAGCHLLQKVSSDESGFTSAMEEVRPKWMTFFYKKMTPSKFMPDGGTRRISSRYLHGIKLYEALIHWDKNSLDVNILDQVKSSNPRKFYFPRSKRQKERPVQNQRTKNVSASARCPMSRNCGPFAKRHFSSRSRGL